MKRVTGRRPWWLTIRRRARFLFEPVGDYYGIAWLHPHERQKHHPPVKPNRRRTHRRRS